MDRGRDFCASSI